MTTHRRSDTSCCRESQVSHKSMDEISLPWENRFEFDVQYVENISFGLDLKILFKTAIKVLKSEGVSAQGHATMPKFSEYIEGKKSK